MRTCNACGYGNPVDAKKCVCGNALVVETSLDEVSKNDLINLSQQEVIVCPKCGNTENKYAFKQYGKDRFVYCKVRACGFKFKPIITKKTKIYLHVNTFDLDITKTILKDAIKKLEEFTV